MKIKHLTTELSKTAIELQEVNTAKTHFQDSLKLMTTSRDDVGTSHRNSLDRETNLRDELKIKEEQRQGEIEEKQGEIEEKNLELKKTKECFKSAMI